MATVYKVQNMQLTVGNIIHVADHSVEDEVAVDHHSVAVADHSVEDEVALIMVIIKVLANRSKVMVHHQWLDVHLLVDQAEVLVVL
jgi:hypothetical protein